MTPAGCVLWGAMGLSLTGCANPGPPRPPSLELPALVRDLRVERVGDRVEAAWTTPRLTTEKTGIVGPVTAVLCREADTKSAAGRVGGTPGPGAMACREVAREKVAPGASSVEVSLAPDLRIGNARLLTYRVELLNANERSAGLSGPAWALAGAAPPAAGTIAAKAGPRGVQVTWSAAAATVEDGQMEVTRRMLTAPPPAQGSASAAKVPRVAVPKRKGQAEGVGDLHLRAADQAATGSQAGEGSGRDAGGLIDTSVQPGGKYRYVAQRVRTVTLGGHTLQMAGEASAPVTVDYRDVFPPSPPQGLQAIAVGELSGKPGEAAALAVDLSWEPSPEGDVAGYILFRSDAHAGGPMPRLNQAPVTASAYRDTTVVAGTSYRYRVTAVDTHGNVSSPSAEVDVKIQP